MMATAAKQVDTEYDRHAGSRDEAKMLEAARPIIGRLSLLADEQVRLRQLIEQRWLEDLRNYFGRYEDNVEKALLEEKRSTVFVKLTRNKTNSWAARISDILFPTDDKNWGIKPTPIPMLVEQARAAIAKAKAAVDATNEAADPEQQERMKEIADSFAAAARQTQTEIDEANKRCERMEKTIDDQLVESDYVAQCRDVIEDGCRLGTGILKGPMTSHKLRKEWKQEHGFWTLKQIPDPTPEFHRVDPWHFFPDMSATKIKEAEFTFERHLPTKKDLKRLAKKLGFNRAGVARLLQEGPRPLTLDVDHLTQLRVITGEGEGIKDRFVMWEYHGALECDEICDLLRAMGQHEKAEKFEREKDPLDDYRVIVHFCNDEVLKIAPEYPMDSGEGLYSVWNFEKGETSIFGIGVPNIMADSQRALNGAWRMMMDNAALSVGPQILINRTVVAPEDGSYALRPLKVWLMSSTAGVMPNVPAFQTFNVEMNQEQLAGIIELAKMFIDEETGMPQVAQGEQGSATKTLGGMSMLFNSANVVFRRIVKAWDDDLTKPTIRRAYDWNMQFNPDDTIKGDMQVDARGTSVLLVREIQSQTLMNIMTNWTTHPVLGAWIKVREGLVKTVQTLMIPPDDILKTQDDYDTDQQAAAAQAEQEEGGGESDPNAVRLQIAQLELAFKREQLAGQERMEQMERDIRIAELSEKTGLTREQIAAKYQIESKRIESSERMKAVDVAVEGKRAREAKAAGGSPTEATGQGVG